ncbi:enoyl-CoA hydratase/isomerase family protein [Salinibacterium sp. GXW1014]|uniref:enoyl-CoA hydratase/isomerase family protein n=1 Tax=Salinibacterium sp. GXW1014 TaxID=3377838 RepID=UPI00383A33C9
MNEFHSLDVARAASILTVTINRPEARNALNAQAIAELRAVLELAAEDDDIGGVIFTGHGERVFVSGADIAELRGRDLKSGLGGATQRLLSELQALDKPTIAAINGHALGGGCEFALACDIRIASADARMGLPEVGLGIIPGAGGTQRLARHVGLGRAVEMILTGRLLDAHEAQRIGLVSEVVEGPQLPGRAREVMQGILQKAPLAIRLAKMITRTSMDTDETTGLMVERLAQALLYTTDDKREGTGAFLERRTPEFKGE